MNRSDIPNIITFLRICLVLPVIAALVNQAFSLALLLYLVAGISDGLDGYIAKRYHYVTRLGSILDPLADKLLLVGTFVALAWLELLPWWLVLAVVLRDVLIVVGAAAYHIFIGRYEMEPTLISKLNTLVQIALGLAVVMSQSLIPLPAWLLDWMVFVVLGTTIVSGVDYVWTWGRRALEERRSRQRFED
ncbi:MAG: CDP-alcohol phosphatidyltransferase family protein [Gammaproteobacteria bacterium]